jgi:hypothetical protein
MCAIGAVFGLVGGVMSAMGQMQAANAQAAGLKAQAAWQTREASVEGIKTAYEIQQMRRQTEGMLGSQVAQWAATGIEGGGGTPEDVAMATVQEREMEVQARRFQGEEAVNKNLYDAKMSKMQAKSAKQAGMIGAMSSIVGAVGNAFGSIGSMGGGGGTSLTSAFNMGASAPAATPSVATTPQPYSGGNFLLPTMTAPRITPYGSYSGFIGAAPPRYTSF